MKIQVRPIGSVCFSLVALVLFVPNEVFAEDEPLALPEMTDAETVVVWQHTRALDLNNDGFLDLIGHGVNTPVFQVRLGDGQGGFGAEHVYTGLYDLWDMRLADLNGDGFLDVVHETRFPVHRLMFRYNNGDGTFQDERRRVPEGDSLSWKGFSDIDADGDVDILYLMDSSSLVMLKNFNNSSLGGPSTVLERENVREVQFSDFNGDGAQDMVLSVWDGSGIYTFEVWLNDGSGQFSLTSSSPGPEFYRESRIVDLNGDSFGDLVMLEPGPASGPEALLTVRLSDGAGGLGAPGVIVGSDSFHGVISGSDSFNVSIVTEDIDGDDDVDVYLHPRYNGVRYAPTNTSQIYMNDGGGVFTHSQTLWTIGRELFDVDGDGALDIVDTNSRYKAFLADAPGVFPVPKYSVIDGVKRVYLDIAEVADLDQDGNLDVVTLFEVPEGDGHTLRLGVAWGLGDGYFGSPTILRGGDADDVDLSTFPNFVVLVEDLDADGLGDIFLVADDRSEEPVSGTYACMNLGSRSFAASASLDEGVPGWLFLEPAPGQRSPWSTGSVAVFGDLNGDGLPDMVTPAFLVDLFVFVGVRFNMGGGQFADPVAVVADQELLSGRYVRLGDFDGDNDLDLFMYGDRTGRVAINDGTGFFPETVSSRNTSILEPHVFTDDLDADGDLDVLGIYYSSPGTRFFRLLNNGSGGLTRHDIFNPELNIDPEIVGDFDGDGDLDIAGTIEGGSFSNAERFVVVLNQGGGAFTRNDTYNVETGAVAAFGDFDQDGSEEFLYQRHVILGTDRVGAFPVVDFLDEGDACVADLDGSGSLNFGDVTAFLTLYGAGDLGADLDSSGSLNFGDVTTFLTLYAQGCP